MNIAALPSNPIPGGTPLVAKLDKPLLTVRVEGTAEVRRGGFLGIGGSRATVDTSRDWTFKISPHFTPALLKQFSTATGGSSYRKPPSTELLLGRYASVEAAVTGAANLSAGTPFGQMMAVVEAQAGVFRIAPVARYYTDARDVFKGGSQYYVEWKRPVESTPFTRPNDWTKAVDGKVLTRSAGVKTVQAAQDFVKALVLGDRWFDLRNRSKAVDASRSL